MSDLNTICEKKRSVFREVDQSLKEKGIKIQSKDDSRPWGGFFVIDTDSTQVFIDHYFTGASIGQIDTNMHLSPKVLLVQPEQRLSWQYHHRRSEIWTVAEGEVGVIASDTDDQGDLRVLKRGDVIQLSQGERHRLVGLGDWAVVAEIWQHTDPDNPSNEDDIVRLQDDYGR